MKQAYRRLCAQHHPDVLPRHRPGQASTDSGPLVQPRSGERADADTAFLEIQQAYRTLRDRYARAQWEREEQEWEWRRALLAGLGAVEMDPPAPGGDAQWQRALLEVGSRIRGIASQIHTARWLPLTGAFFREHAPLSLALAGCALAALLFGFYAHRDDLPASAASEGEEAVITQDAPGAPQPRPSRNSPPGAVQGADRMPRPTVHAIKQESAFQSPQEPGAAQPILASNPAPAGLALDTPGSSLSEGVDRPGPRTESGAGSGLIPEMLPNGSSLALTQAGERAALNPARSPASAGEWHGRWAAICTANEGMDIYRGSLDIATDARFRWVNLVNGKPGSLGPLEIDPSGSGDQPLRLVRRGAERIAGERTGPEPESAIAVLERAASSGRWMTWRDVPGDTTSTSDMGRRMQGARGKNDELRKPPRTGPCAQWRLFPDDGVAALDGLWVLPSNEKPAEGALAAEYVELRMARSDDRYNGRFVGRYRVPVASMPPEMRFGFSLPTAPMGWQPWENADGATGTVLLTPVGRSRLVVVWKRTSLPSEGPHLSGGVAVLRRME